MSKRNKKAGNNCELYFKKKLEKLHNEKLYTTRNISTLRDSQKIDIENESLTLQPKYQVKQSINTPKFSTILSEMSDDDINVILYQKTQKKGARFYKEGDYVIMKFDDFEKIMKEYLKNK